MFAFSRSEILTMAVELAVGFGAYSANTNVELEGCFLMGAFHSASALQQSLFFTNTDRRDCWFRHHFLESRR